MDRGRGWDTWRGRGGLLKSEVSRQGTGIRGGEGGDGVDEEGDGVDEEGCVVEEGGDGWEKQCGAGRG